MHHFPAMTWDYALHGISWANLFMLMASVPSFGKKDTGTTTTTTNDENELLAKHGF